MIVLYAINFARFDNSFIVKYYLIAMYSFIWLFLTVGNSNSYTTVTLQKIHIINIRFKVKLKRDNVERGKEGI
jgi:hypothetical protein